MSHSTQLPKHASNGERLAASRLIDALLDRDCTVSVANCEGYEVKRSKDKNAILSGMSLTGEETIVARASNGERVGSFFLVYGNAVDGSELICDHTENRFCHIVSDLVQS